MATATPARSSLAPREAIFTPLGFSRHRGERWLHIRAGGEDRIYRPSQALGLGFLLDLYPDHQHWANAYPSRYYHGHRVDWRYACAEIKRLCIEAGEIKPE
jgi:hypothetical protein